MRVFFDPQLDFWRHLFHEAPHRGARLRIGLAAPREVSCQVRPVQQLANVPHLFAHFVGAADEHSALVDELFERELLHLRAVPFMAAVGFRVSPPRSQTMGVARRRVVFSESLGRGRAGLARTFTYVSVIHTQYARRRWVMSCRFPRTEVSVHLAAKLFDLIQERNEHHMKTISS